MVVKGKHKYMARGGKYYHYAPDGKRSEISKDEYEKVIGPRVSGRPDVEAKAQNKHSIALKIDGKRYSASVDGMTAKDLAAHVQSIAKHSPGRAIQWLKKNGTITHVGEKPKTKDSTKTFKDLQDRGLSEKISLDVAKTGMQVVEKPTRGSQYNDESSTYIAGDVGDGYRAEIELHNDGYRTRAAGVIISPDGGVSGFDVNPEKSRSRISKLIRDHKKHPERLS